MGSAARLQTQQPQHRSKLKTEANSPRLRIEQQRRAPLARLCRGQTRWGLRDNKASVGLGCKVAAPSSGYPSKRAGNSSAVGTPQKEMETLPQVATPQKKLETIPQVSTPQKQLETTALPLHPPSAAPALAHSLHTIYFSHGTLIYTSPGK